MMFYKNKKTNEIVELIYSDNAFCITVPLNEIENVEGELNGSIFYGNKDTFKKSWKKEKKVKVQPLEKEAIDSIIATFLFDRKRFTSESKLDELVVLTQHLYENAGVN